MNPLHPTSPRVLVTRPAHQAEALCHKLSDTGRCPVSFPTLAIEPITDDTPDAQVLRQRFVDLDHYQRVLFVSANAARLAYDWIDRYWPQLPVGIEWLAVGRATAESLQQLGLPCQAAAGSMDSEALLALPSLQQLTHTKILICRGEGGREHLRNTLVSRGAEVDYAELYRRVLPTYSAADVESRIYESLPSAILVSSGEALTNLARLCDLRRLQAVPVVVPSERVAAQARQISFTTVVTAANATDDAMITALDGVVSPDTSERG